jgi:hypothetical protein
VLDPAVAPQDAAQRVGGRAEEIGDAESWAVQRVVEDERDLRLGCRNVLVGIGESAAWSMSVNR